VPALIGRTAYVLAAGFARVAGRIGFKTALPNAHAAARTDAIFAGFHEVKRPQDPGYALARVHVISRRRVIQIVELLPKPVARVLQPLFIARAGLLCRRECPGCRMVSIGSCRHCMVLNCHPGRGERRAIEPRRPNESE
jgi:hypothetical protein